jgi:hypothetical protein
LGTQALDPRRLKGAFIETLLSIAVVMAL